MEDSYTWEEWQGADKVSVFDLPNTSEGHYLLQVINGKGVIISSIAMKTFEDEKKWWEFWK